MTKREKRLGLGLLVIMIVFAHLWVFNLLKKKEADSQKRITSLTKTLDSYRMMNQSAAAYTDEIQWIRKYAAPKISFQNAQTELQNFLVSTCKRLGFTPYKQSLISKPENELGVELEATHFERVKIQISARATEKQIYQWLVAIHQPQKMRILSYLKMSPPENDSEEINCQIIAEQFISNQ